MSQCREICLGPGASRYTPTPAQSPQGPRPRQQDVELPEEELLAAELSAQIRAAVAQLPRAQREVVTLRDIDGFSAEEICELLELTDANQRVLLHRGRSKVRAALEQYIAARTLTT